MPSSPSTSTSIATSSADEASDGSWSGATLPDQTSAPPFAQKKRKATYYVRKDELEVLHGEAESLLEEIKKIKTIQRDRQLPLLDALASNALLQLPVQENSVAIANMESSLMWQPSISSIHSYIHLPRSFDERQRLVLGLKDFKLQQALAHVLALTRGMDLQEPRNRLENFVSANGDHINIHFEVAQFRQNTATVENVYDGMVESTRTQEMRIAEQLGILTVRESDANEDDIHAAQIRMLATTEDGAIAVEKNLLMYSGFWEQSELLDEPHGLLVTDFVDIDDVFPYDSNNRIRKDFVSIKLVVACSPSCVALIHWSHALIRRNDLADATTLKSLARNASGPYFSCLVRGIDEHLGRRQAEPPSLIGSVEEISV